jgi:hypothetical protein
VYGNSGNISISPQSLPAGIVDGPYNQTFTVSGASGATMLELLSGTLPPGLTFDAATGVLSGTATTAGTFNFTIRAEDSAYDSATQTYTLVINPPRVGSGGSSGSGGCSSAMGPFPAALAMLALLATGRKRRWRA